MTKPKKFDDALKELEAQEHELWDSQYNKVGKEGGLSEEEWRKKSEETDYKKRMIKYLLEEDGKKISFLIGFHDLVNAAGGVIYQMIRPPQYEVKPEEARQNMHDFIMKEFPQPLDEGEPNRWEKERGKKWSPRPLEERIQALGKYYLPYEEITTVDHDILWQLALQYDGKGLIANPKETLPELVYRGNSLLYLSQQLKNSGKSKGLNIKVETETWMVRPWVPSHYEGRVGIEDIRKALERVPYYMDLSWFPAYVKDEFIVPAGAVTFTLPHYNGLGFIQVLPSYKSRNKFLEILSHELVHAGTVYLDSRRDYLETKAYHVGRGSLMGEYLVAVNQRPNLLLRGIEWTWNFFLPWFPVPNRVIKYLPKAKTALQILATTSTLRDVEGKLTTLYGKKGNYILGRLTGDEMEEFHYTNDIPARIAMKDSLKWQIMKTNVETLE